MKGIRNEAFKDNDNEIHMKPRVPTKSRLNIGTSLFEAYPGSDDDDDDLKEYNVDFGITHNMFIGWQGP